MGVLYLGLMITKDGPKLVEYNCRFGDPECQVLMPRLKSDLLTALLAARDGSCCNLDLRWRDEVGADRGDGVEGLSRRLRERPRDHRPGRGAALPGVQIFHAGTEQRGRQASSPSAAGC